MAMRIVAELAFQTVGLERVRQQVRDTLGGAAVPINVQLSPQALASTSQLVSNIRANAVAAQLASSQFSSMTTASSQMGNSMKRASSDAAASAAAMKSFGDSVATAGQRFTAFLVAAAPIAGVFSGIRTGIRDAIAFERQMVRVAQVGSDTSAELKELQGDITSLATRFGVSSKELGEASLTLRQAGLSIREVRASLEAVGKSTLAPTFANSAQSVEGLIAAFRQFNIPAKEAESLLGSINAVSASYAVENQDLITVIRRAGGAFATFGGNIHELLGLFTSVRQTTRESASEIANGFRVIFARMNRPEISNSLRELGINLRYTADEASRLGDTNLTNQFVGPYLAVQRLNEALSTLRTTDPRYSAVVEQLGGTRQISRVIPLIQQFSVAQQAANISQSGGVSLAIAAEKAQGSLLVRLTKVKEEWLALFRSIVDSKGFQTLTDTALSLASALSKLLDIGKPLIPVLGIMAATKLTALGIGAVGSRVRGFATGGRVPGQGNKDEVPIVATPGEFVIQKKAAERIGHHNLELLNSGAVQRFATGGEVRRLTPEQQRLVTENMDWARGLINSRRVRSFVRHDPEEAESVAIEELVNRSLTYDKNVPSKTGEPLTFRQYARQAIQQAMRRSGSKRQREQPLGGDAGIFATGTVSSREIEPSLQASINEEAVRAGILPAGPTKQAFPAQGLSQPNTGNDWRKRMEALYGPSGVRRSTYPVDDPTTSLVRRGGRLPVQTVEPPAFRVPQTPPLLTYQRDYPASRVADRPLIVQGQPETPIRLPDLTQSGVGRRLNASGAGYWGATAGERSLNRQSFDAQGINGTTDPLQIKQAAMRAIASGEGGYDILQAVRPHLSPAQYGQVERAWQREVNAGVAPRQGFLSRVRGGFANLGNDYTRLNERLGQSRVFSGFGGLFATVGGTYAGEGVSHLGGSAEQAVVSGNTGAFSAARASGGILSGAAAGLGAGLVTGNPIVGVVGAVIGGLTGLASALTQKDKEIRDVQIAKSITRAGDLFRRIESGHGTEQDERDLMGELAANRARFVDEASVGAANWWSRAANGNAPLGLGSVSGYSGLTSASERQAAITAAEPRIREDQLRHSQSARRILEQRVGQRLQAGASPDEVLAQLRSGDFNAELLNTVTTGQVGAQRNATIEGLVRGGARQQLAQQSGNFTERNLNTIGLLVSSVSSAADSLRLLQSRAEGLTTAFDGTQQAINVSFGGHALEQLGRPDRGALAPLSILRAVGGEAGARLYEQGEAADSIARVLPGILQEVGRHPNIRDHEFDFSTEVSQRLRNQLGPRAAAGIHVVENQLNREQEHGGVPNLLRRLELDTTGVAQSALRPYVDTLQPASRALEQIESRVNSFTGSLSRLAQQFETTGREQDKLASLSVTTGRIRAENLAATTGNQRDGLLRFFSLSQAQSGLQARQERLTGTTGFSANDPLVIGRELAITTGQIPAAIEERDAVARRTGGRGPAFQSAAFALEALRGRANDLQQALRHLTDVSERNASAQERLQSIEQDRTSRLSLGERYLRSDLGEQSELNRSFTLASAAASQGNLDAFNVEDRRSILDVLRSAGNARLSGLPGQPVASDLADRLVGNSAGGVFQLDNQRQGEVATLRQSILENATRAEQAQAQLIEHQTRLSGDFFTNLNQQHEQFFNRLAATLAAGRPATGLSSGGVVRGYADGGSIFKPIGTDVIPAMLSPGEHVINADSARANRALLEQINAFRGTYRPYDRQSEMRYFGTGDGGMRSTYRGMQLRWSIPQPTLSSSTTTLSVDGRSVNSGLLGDVAYRADGGPIGLPPGLPADGSARRRPHVYDPDNPVGPSSAEDFLDHLRNRGVAIAPTPPGRSVTEVPEQFDANGRVIVRDRPDPNGGLRNPFGGNGYFGEAQQNPQQQQNQAVERELTLQAAINPYGASAGLLQRRAIDRALVNQDWNLLSASMRARDRAWNAEREDDSAPAGQARRLRGYSDRLSAFVNNYIGGRGDVAGRAVFANRFAGDLNSLRQRQAFANDSVAGRVLDNQRQPRLDSSVQDILRRFVSGQVLRFSSGGIVPGVGSSDSVPALLTPGERVIPRHYANGGAVQPAGTVSGFADSSQVFADSITGFTSAIGIFADKSSAFVEAVKHIPTSISFNHGPQRLEVVMNGAEVLARMTPAVQEMIERQTETAIRNAFRETLPDAPQPG